MHAKKIVCFLIALLLFSGLMCSVGALPDATVSFRGGGVTIDLTYPEEAHPNTNITHYITITSSVAATLRNFTVVIKAPVNSAWQEIFNAQDTFSKSLPLSYNLTLLLPQEANGMLRCFIFVNTSIINDLSTTFYTTLVSEPTFSEMFANYTILQADYETLLNEYNGLLVNYSSLFANYTALLSEHNDLLADYNSQVATYQALLSNYNKLSDDYEALNADYRSKINEHSTLQSDYNELNSTRNNLLESLDTLQVFYDALNDTYIDLQTNFNTLQKRITDSENDLNNDRIVMLIFIITLAALIAFIIYIKRKKQEPYVVIRKETVSMEPDETS
jgi:hypothetical protein